MTDYIRAELKKDLVRLIHYYGVDVVESLLPIAFQEAKSEHCEYEQLTGSIKELGFSAQTENALRRAGYLTVADLKIAVDQSPESLLGIRNFGQRRFDEVLSVLRARGVVTW